MTSAGGSSRLGQVVVQDEHHIPRRLGHPDGLRSGDAVVHGDQQGVGDPLDQGGGDAIAVGEPPGNDGFRLHPQVAEELDQDGRGGHPVGVIVPHDDHRHAPLKGAADDEVRRGGDALHLLRGHREGGEKVLLRLLRPGQDRFQHRLGLAPFAPCLHSLLPPVHWENTIDMENCVP